MKYFFIFLIRLYQWTIGPFTQGNCRFYPSCSEYGIKAFKKHGFFKGFYLTVRRLLRCHPWHPGGCDPLP
ncbi:membrane protein insertion efficiency factor YidD [Candidatus Neptunichlamydia sp. REUL1]|uniref:membrane protein insertion efficiency factor YidD n=1 Tax=Candidatus Neptunichlamydia sp. REUL1 TaxID=3064277 RepID=UPI00403D5DEA